MKASLLFTIALTVSLLPSGLQAWKANHWSSDGELNRFAAILSGDASMKGHSASAGAGFGGIAKNLAFAAAGRLPLGIDRWPLSDKFCHMKLKVNSAVDVIGQKSWLVEPSVGCWFCYACQSFAGVRCNSIEAPSTSTARSDVFTATPRTAWELIMSVNISLLLSGQKLALYSEFGTHTDIVNNLPTAGTAW